MTKLWITKKGQMFVCIPKNIASAAGWVPGDRVDFSFIARDKLKIEKRKKEAEA